MIEVRNLTVGFDDKTVLEDLSVQFIEDETAVILGASGSGKSVLMKTIEGLIIPWGGQVLIDDEDMFARNRHGQRKLRQKLAMLFQGAALLDSMDVFQNVALPLVEHKDLSLDTIREIVLERLEWVGLHNVEKMMPSELSGGMKKRVGLARALVSEPKYLIYDEPTTGLDPEIATEITELILKTRKTLNLTSIIITHDIQCIQAVADKIVFIHDKKLAFCGEYSAFLKSDVPKLQQFKPKDRQC